MATTDLAIAAPSAGMILPPPEIRALVEKMAPYIARNGPSFEERLREKERANMKFSFLNPMDPYYRYYALRLEECRLGKESSLPMKQEKAQPETGATESRQAQGTGGDAKPRDFAFSTKLPPISAQDLDILRLTARFVAKNGRNLIATLSQRESRNFQFDFLRSNHALYPYFNSLVQQYVQVLAPPRMMQETLAQAAKDRQVVFDRCAGRAAYLRTQQREKQESQAQEEKDRQAYAAIDWHAFSVCETITFTDAELSGAVSLPPPVDLGVLKKASMEQKKLMSELEIPSLALQDSPMLAIEAAPAVPAPANTTSIRKRKAQQTLLKCGRCGSLIPADEMEEHTRIELLDPQWKQQKARQEQKQSGTNLSMADAAANIKRLQQQRGGGGQGEEVTKRARQDTGPRRM
jgi:splicing factor 3A subunit 1